MNRGSGARVGFLALAAITLSLGIAAFTAALTLVDSLLWRPPPFADVDRLAVYGASYRGDPTRVASPRFVGAMDGLASVESRGATRLPRAVNLVMGEQRWLLQGQRVDPGFLATLGVAPAAGRNLTDGMGAMVSFDFWRRHGGGLPSILGREVIVDGRRMPVIGVLPKGYRFFQDVDVVLPMRVSGSADDAADNLIAVARLRPGATVDALSSEVAGRTAREASRHPLDTGADADVGATPLALVLVRNARAPLLGLMACAGGVLAAAGIALSNLMLGRGLTRSRDTAIRMALGARGLSPWSSTVKEALAIGVLAAGLGLPAGALIVQAFQDVVPETWLSSALPIETSPRVYLTATAVDVALVLMAAVSGMVHDSLADLLRERIAVDGRHGLGRLARATRIGLILVQSAFAGALLVFATVAVARLVSLEKVAPGFDAKGGTFVPMHLDVSSYPTRDHVLAMLDDLRRGTDGTSLSGPLGFTNLLPRGDGLVMPFLDATGRRHFVRFAVVTPGTTEALGLTRLAGRAIDDTDRAGATPVAVVNTTFVQTMGGTLGGFVRSDSRLAVTPPLRIVGIVADTRVAGPSERAVATVFVPLSQVDPAIYAFIRRLMPMYAVWRVPAAEERRSEEAFASRLREVAPFVAAGAYRRLADLVGEPTAEARRNANLLAAAALAALVLATVGLYSSQSVDLAVRHREFALRTALGEPRRRLVHGAITGYFLAAVAGAVLGSIAAVLTRPWPQVERVDAVAVAAAVLVFIAAALVAIARPAWWAANLQPLPILRGG